MMRQQLIDFYRAHNPDNLDNLDEARPRLRRFRFLHDARGVCALMIRFLRSTGGAKTLCSES